MQKALNQNKKKLRIMNFFIESATEIALEEGIEAITIRKVAALAGYNSATLYNYFANIEQLLAFTALYNVSDYLASLEDILKKDDSSLKKYLLAWQSYCTHSFTNPSIYNYVFSSSSSDQVLMYLEDYVSVFPERLHFSNEIDITETIMGKNSYQRNYAFIQPCIDDGFFHAEDVNNLIDFGYIIQQGFMYRLTYDKKRGTVAETTAMFMKYFIEVINQYLLPGHEKIITIETLQ